LSADKATALDYAEEWFQENMVEFLTAYEEAAARNSTGIFLQWLDDNQELLDNFHLESNDVYKQ